MYDKVSTSLNFVDNEKEVMKFWEEKKVFEKSIEAREGHDTFTFYDGPPTANGKPHIGHVLTRVIKDLVPRYKTMKGYKVLRKAGWDTHGLPVELEVEKALGLDGKPQIEDYGVEPFIKKCKESVWKYQSEWEKMSDRVGYWADMENPYITYDNNYIESEWWAIKQIQDKGLLYKGHKIVPYCPRCGTSLSSHEVAQGYKDVKEKSAVVRFRVPSQENTYIMAWTTTPWTLPSNVALAVNPDETYVKIKCPHKECEHEDCKHETEYAILAEALVESIFGQECEVVEKFVGCDLKGLEYEPLYNFKKLNKKAHYVVADGYVTLTDGTGIVHIAPAFGEDDARVGRDNDLPFLQLVDEQGKFSPETGEWAGTFVKDADKYVLIDLDQRGLLFSAPNYEHSYPFCWRCDTPLIYYARETWFVKMTAVKENLLKNNRAINWMPDNIKEGRMGNFLENVIDWGLSRSRYWGTPLPVWECECGHYHVIGSREELRELATTQVQADIELHKPYIDAVKIKCPHCGKEMSRVSDVIDCWFDSGSMPFAQWHYPFENEEIFKENFPADFISEAIDQTRGWFYTLLAISTVLFDTNPFKNVIVLGHVQDKDGQKMSKHKGNVVDVWGVLDKQGADAVRWFFYTNSAPWLPNRFYEEAISESQRKFMGTLWNTYAFYVLYADIDNFNPSEYKLEYDKLSELDKWVLSRLNTVVKKVDENLNNYKIVEAGRAAQEFIDEVSNWYVRRSRERFWQKDMPQDKINAYMTLYTVLETMSKLMAPFIPFMTEQIYQNMVRRFDDKLPESVHLCDYPVCNEDMINEKLEEDMDLILKVVTQGRAARNAANIKNRQPLSKLYVKAYKELEGEHKSIVADELNVKEVEFTDEIDNFTSYSIKPNLKTVGPKYGKILGAIRQELPNMDGNKIVKELKVNGKVEVTIAGEKLEFVAEDLLIEAAKGARYATVSEGDLTVVLDTELTEKLIEEGYVRELVSKIQNLRKEAGFEVQDYIEVYYGGNTKVEKIIADNADEIASEVLARKVENAKGTGFEKEIDVNGEKITIAVNKLW
ncbi:MAG: isoleucine--tRNA ligase [Clostridiales bacterium]|nr:isoleucine--tRNA ligase [Clostridiales bacterium]